ncbi:C4b-binding protein alpha chain-like isoform X2 [Eretmochelys imbricata]
MVSAPRCRPGARGLLALLLLLLPLPLAGACRKSCEHPGDLANGKIHITDLLFGSNITFSCDKGLVGHDTSQCVIDGTRVTWNHKLPFCEAGCQKPEVQTGSMVNALDEKMWYHVNETLPFKCSPGYQFSSHSQLPATDRCSITCLANGSWTALPVCKKQSTSDVCEMASVKEVNECGVSLERLRTLLEVQKLYLEIKKLELELKSQ